MLAAAAKSVLILIADIVAWIKDAGYSRVFKRIMVAQLAQSMAQYLNEYASVYKVRVSTLYTDFPAV